MPAAALLGNWPALAAFAPGACDVMDACAAPGNKTSHAAMLLGDRGAVYAFDKSQTRAAVR